MVENFYILSIVAQLNYLCNQTQLWVVNPIDLRIIIIKILTREWNSYAKN